MARVDDADSSCFFFEITVKEVSIDDIVVTVAQYNGSFALPENIAGDIIAAGFDGDDLGLYRAVLKIVVYQLRIRVVYLVSVDAKADGFTSVGAQSIPVIDMGVPDGIKILLASFVLYLYDKHGARIYLSVKCTLGHRIM